MTPTTSSTRSSRCPTALPPSGSSATCARSASCTTWPSAGSRAAPREGRHYMEISRATGASTATITRIAQWLHHGTGGYREALASASVGTAVPPRRDDDGHDARRPGARATLGDLRAGSPAARGPQQGPAAAARGPAPPRRGALASRTARARSRRASRTSRSTSSSSAPMTSPSSWPTAWPTWASPARTCSSRAAPSSPVQLELGYGHCRLEAAVPDDSPATSLDDLAGLRLATSHPRATRESFARLGVPVEVVTISGAVEVAPRLGPRGRHRRPRLDAARRWS